MVGIVGVGREIAVACKGCVVVCRWPDGLCVCKHLLF